MSDSRRHGRRSPAGRVRIVGGEWRSRPIVFHERPGLRPTPDRVRETLFNWLGQRLDGLRCLDLFAGSGALGFEAASRGASEVVMVELDRSTAAVLRENAATLGARNVEIVEGDALEVLGRSGAPFDVVFLDPPFGSDLLAAAVGRVLRRLAPEGRVYVESPRGVNLGPEWDVWREGKAGQVLFRLLRPASTGGLQVSSP